MTDDSQVNQMVQQMNGGGIPDMNSINSILSSFMPLIIISGVATVAIMVLWGFSVAQRYRVNRAIIETRDILKAMQKAGVSLPPAEPKTPQPAAPPTAAPPAPVSQPAADTNKSPSL